MEERYDGIWLNIEEDDSSRVVHESYRKKLDRLEVIYQRADGCYLPYSFRKQRDPQWRLPVWCPENEKAILPTFESAIEYLSSYVASNT